jgi:hypothetical protein
VRYYSVVITKPDGSPFLFKSLGGLALTSLLPSGPQNPISGLANPAALNIEFDLTAFVYNAPDNNSWLRIWGLGLQDIGNAADLTMLNVSVYGGMSKGLPLANPQQAGLLVKGQVLAAWGNWIGTDQTVEMALVAGGVAAGSPSKPSNFPFSWQAGLPLSVAIAQTLSTAMPGPPPPINISPKLVLNYPVSGWYQSAQQFSDFVNDLSSAIIGGDYPGVTISTDGQTVRVSDGTAAPASSTKTIGFQDLIGQPTWVAGGIISVKTVLRADISVNDTVSLPPSLVTTSLAAAQFNYGLAKDKTTFSGVFGVNEVHHYGNFRQPTADSWTTVFQLRAEIG